MKMALTFSKAKNCVGLIIIVRDSRGSPIIGHSELIPCRDPLWMAATALLRASHFLALIHLQEPCFCVLCRKCIL